MNLSKFSYISSKFKITNGHAVCVGGQQTADCRLQTGYKMQTKTVPRLTRHIVNV